MAGHPIPEDRRLDDHDDADRIRRLPRWAQAEILSNRETIARLETTLGDGDPDSDTFTDELARGSATWIPRPLGKAAHVRFELGDLPGEPRGIGQLEARIVTRYGRRLLNVRAPNGSLVILPDSSNSTFIEARER